MNSASLCSLAGRYNNPIPTRCLAPIDFLKIPAQNSVPFGLLPRGKNLTFWPKIDKSTHTSLSLLMDQIFGKTVFSKYKGVIYDLKD
jgi:hypothetical protein